MITVATNRSQRLRREGADEFMDAVLEPLRWDRARIEEVQEARLLETIALAYDHSAVIRDRWNDAGVTPADIVSRQTFVERAPFIDADDVRDVRRAVTDRFMGMLCIPVHDLTAIGTTSGTSGLPQPLPQTARDVREQSTQRDLAMNGVGPGSRVLVVGNANRSGHTSSRHTALGAYPIFLDAEQASVAHLVRVVREFRPTHWWIMTGPLLVALRAYESETGDNLAEAFSSVGTLAWGGEPLSGASRSVIEGWGMSIRNMTSLGNACATVECPQQNGSHTWEDLVLVECLDLRSGEQVPDGGRGELVVTTVADRAAPLIRYRSGDLIRFTRECCACGCAHARIWTIGRLADVVSAGGVDLLPTDVWPIVESVPETAGGQFQIVRSLSTESRLHVRVGIESSTPSSRVGALRDELRTRLLEGLGVACDVELLTNAELLARRTGMKLQRVVDQ